ncbi:hypothetical protein K438DRAFT_1883153 [Mycena galopus ATCC 62051]|nr:hypothetical protein K438DRAFT_1883153 [Mycena galopus ATCC 62051]
MRNAKEERGATRGRRKGEARRRKGTGLTMTQRYGYIGGVRPRPSTLPLGKREAENEKNEVGNARKGKPKPATIADSVPRPRSSENGPQQNQGLASE